MAALLDMNGDSFLDLVDINSAEGKIYLNDGAGNYSDFENINIVPPHTNSVISIITFGDADNDGDLDLYIGYSFSDPNTQCEKNLLYLNNGSGNFEKASGGSALVSDMTMTMGANWVDYDNDGDMDLFTLESSVYGPPVNYSDALFENKGDLSFTKHVIEAVEYRNTHQISPIWGDLDNDGDLDLLIAVEKNDFYGHTSALKHNILYQNNGDGTFTEIKAGVLVEKSSHTATMEDYDNDGDLDVLLAGFAWAPNGSNYLCENEGNENSWLGLTCQGNQSNRSAIGTRIYAIATINGEHVMQTREIMPITGHNSIMSSSRMHFGLGDAVKIDTLIVKWPLGNVDTFMNVKADQFYRAIEDSVLEIDFRATNSIRLNSQFEDTVIYEAESLSFDLASCYELIKGDTFPELADENLSFSLYKHENAEATNVSIEKNILTVTPGSVPGVSTIQLLVSAGFTERVDGFRVEFAKTSGISPALLKNFRIYPNPASNEINIAFDTPVKSEARIELMEVSGKKLKMKTIPSGSSEIATINLDNLANGIFFLRISCAEYSYTEKLIKIE